MHTKQGWPPRKPWDGALSATTHQLMDSGGCSSLGGEALGMLAAAALLIDKQVVL